MYTPEKTGRQPASPGPMLCYITDRRQFRGDAREQQLRLLEKVRECAEAQVDLVQLREKDLNARDLFDLSQMVVSTLSPGSRTKLLINGRTDVALVCGAHGVHLPAGDLLASEVRAIWDRASRTQAMIGVSAHSPEEVALAESHGADFALFAPVFEKNSRHNSRGLEQLRAACLGTRRAASFMPVLALGGITLGNAFQCLAAGASGIAAIRLFQENSVDNVVRQLGMAWKDSRKNE